MEADAELPEIARTTAAALKADINRISRLLTLIPGNHFINGI
jgi:hypothetical protein